MPARFAALCQRMDLVIEDLQGEAFIHRPMLKGAVTATAPDATRPVQTITAILDDQDMLIETNVPGQRGGSTLEPGRATSNPLLYVRIDTLPRPAIRQGDEFERVAGGARFRVTSLRPDGINMTILELNKVA